MSEERWSKNKFLEKETGTLLFDSVIFLYKNHSNKCCFLENLFILFYVAAVVLMRYDFYSEHAKLAAQVICPLDWKKLANVERQL